MAQPQMKARPPGRRQRQLARAQQLHQSGQAAEAEAEYRRLLSKSPKDPELNYLAGLAALETGNIAGAADRLSLAARFDASNPLYQFHLGVAFGALGRMTDAATAYREAGRLDPTNGDAHFNLGTALQALGALDDAVAAYRQAVAVAPGDGQALNNLGVALKNLGRLDEAREALESALSLDPSNADALSNLGAVLIALDQPSDAAEMLALALEKRPGHAATLNNLGLARMALAQYGEAAKCFGEAIAVAPAIAQAHANLGNVYLALGDRAGAERCYREALSHDPDHADSHANLGNLLRVLGRRDEALTHNRRAAELAPDRAEMFEGLGQTLSVMRDYPAAIEALERALALRPSYVEAEARLLAARQHACQWDLLEERRDALIVHARERMAEGRDCGVEPHTALTVIDDAAFQSEVAAARSRRVEMEHAALERRNLFHHDRGTPAKLRIGYASPYFGNQPTAHLVAGLFEAHDRSIFEVHGYALGPDDGSDWRKRIEAGCDRFADLTAMTTEQAAQHIHNDGIHILVDLRGYAEGSRAGIFALRPAPVQAQHIGFTGSMGAAFIDYLITDDIVTPREDASLYTEKFAVLPGCYLATDDRQPIAEAPPSRAACGLPDEGFVYCCFNASYKIEPVIFGAWMDILERVPGAVLWLLRSNDAAVDNLRREAEARGIDPARLVFAEPLPKAQHLARHRWADLFLDTHFVNAHTTAIDALWAGVPLLSWPGATMVSRVSTSALQAIGLEQMIAADRDSYVAMAAALGRDKAAIDGIRDELRHNRTSWPLFDTAGFARRIEKAFLEMWRTYESGAPPHRIDIPG